MRAAQSQAQGGQSALAELCRLYWYPLYIFARRRGHSPDDAQDLTQGFFLHVVEHRALTGVDRLKGKFRSFLLASFQNHLSDAGDRARRLKRGVDKDFVQLDAEEAEERYRLEPVEFLTPEKMFDARWAMTVLGEALKQLRQEYASAGKISTFEALKAFLDPNNSIAPPSYDEVASRLQVTTGAVKTLIHRLRKRYTTGKTPFRGTPSEVMHEHQHALLPVEQLQDVPQPVVALLEAFLEKDPARRFQNPTELLKAIATVTDAIDTGRRITRESLQKMP